jgi:hypothetical protein
MPAELKLPKVLQGLTYTHHARLAMNNDKYGVMTVLPAILENFKVVEATVKQGVLVKAVLRTPLSSRLDAVFVVNTLTNRVITFWFNERHDSHKTLRRDAYVSGPRV